MNEWSRWFWRISPGDRYEMQGQSVAFMEWIRHEVGDEGFKQLQDWARVSLMMAGIPVEEKAKPD